MGATQDGEGEQRGRGAEAVLAANRAPVQLIQDHKLVNWEQVRKAQRQANKAGATGDT